MPQISDLSSYLQRKLFRQITSRNLVYNTSWEDPRIDRQLLQLDSSSNVVMLTGAGCNALDYLLDNPEQIHCVDINPAQNALLELKQALIRNGEYNLLWDFFGRGYVFDVETIYRQKLCKYVSKDANRFWQQHLNYFNRTTDLPGFYYRGTAGKIALSLRRNFIRNGQYKSIKQLFEAQDLTQQKKIFNKVESTLLTSFQEWLINRPEILSFLGVPSIQRKMINQDFSGGFTGFLYQSLRHIFTELPITDNYFWHVYFKGSYLQTCCPNYLKQNYFYVLFRRVDKIRSYSTSLINFLRRNPGNYSHFVLLDYQDWLVDSDPKILANEWQEILNNARSGSRILFRSAGKSLDFLPSYVFNKVDFKPQLTEPLHKVDRVGTYGSVHLGVVQ